MLWSVVKIIFWDQLLKLSVEFINGDQLLTLSGQLLRLPAWISFEIICWDQLPRLFVKTCSWDYMLKSIVEITCWIHLLKSAVEILCLTVKVICLEAVALIRWYQLLRLSVWICCWTYLLTWAGWTIDPASKQSINTNHADRIESERRTKNLHI